MNMDNYPARPKWSTRRRLLVIGIILLFCLALALVKPAYQQIKIWRAEQFAAEALALIEEPDTALRAWELARAGYALHPEGVSVARALAKVYDAGDPPSAPPFWEQVVTLSKGSPEDRLSLANAYLVVGQWDSFEAVADSLESEGHYPKDIAYKRALMLARRGQFDEALAKVTTLIDNESPPERADYLFVQLTQFSDDPVVRQRGLDHLWQLAQEGGVRGLGALRNLARAPRLDRQETARLADALDEARPVERSDRLLALEVRLRLPDSDRTSLVAQAYEVFNRDQADELAALGRWLNRQRLFQETLNAISVEQAMNRQDLFLVRADAMAMLKEWQSLGLLLDQPRVPLEDYIKSFFRMRVYLEQDDPRRARLAWDRALLSAGMDSVKLNFLAEKAGLLGLKDYQLAALRRMTETALMRRKAFETMITLYQAQGDARATWHTLGQMKAFFPSDPEINNDLIYLGLLLGINEESPVAQAGLLHESDPTMLSYRITLAYALYKEGRNDEALDLIYNLPVNWLAVPERWRVVAGVVLKANSKDKEAITLAATINGDKLFPEEKALLMTILP